MLVRRLRRAVIALCLVAATVPATAAERRATVPLKSLAELEAWRPSNAPWNRAAEPLRARAGADHPLADLWVPVAPAQNRRMRVIAMHDMGAGYLADQDRFPGGTDNDRLYRFTHWQYIDAFVYFSHSRVSFPPPGWTDSAHRNGVLSLGTFDIEGAGMVPELRHLLDDPARRKRIAGKLAEIAGRYGFDGYLVNVEVAMPGDAAARRRRAESLRAFVAELRSAVKKLGPRAEVIWYDSIVRSGALAYQNELNDENKPFFRAADAITVNYDWSPPDRDGSPAHSAAAAGARRLDVYSSVDVFCRDQGRRYCGWNAYLGAGEASRAGTSFGVFAPAWTYEGDGASPDHGNFVQRDRRFWVGTAGDRKPGAGLAAFVAARPVPTALPFTTHFGQGVGKATYRRGAVQTAARWGDVGRVDVLPTWLDTNVAGSGAYRAEITTDAAFEGGSSLAVTANGTPAGHTVRPLFRTAFGKATSLTYTVRDEGLEAALVVVAAEPDGTGRPLVAVLKPAGVSLPAGVGYGVSGDAAVRVLSPATVATINGWSRRSYDVAAVLAGRRIGAIGVLAWPKPGAAPRARLLLGELSVR